MEYEFTLKYRLAAAGSDADELVERLGTARLVEVCPDSVGLTDIAELVGVSRQNMR